jgi:hypothetical protein
LRQFRRNGNNKRVIEGVIEYGEYGSESAIKDTVNHVVVHKKEVTHADMQRFYFLFSLPEQRTKGIMLLQKSGNIGIATQLKGALLASMEAVFPSHSVKFAPLSTQQIFNRYMDRGDLREIRFIKFRLPKSIEDAYAAGHEEIRGTYEMVIRLRNAHGMPFGGKVKALFAGRGSLNEIIDLGEDRFDADNIKFEMSVGGKRRTVSMRDPRDMRAEYDVSDQVKSGRDGNPMFESLSEVANGLLADLERELYGEEGA